jgi:beta-phosphoglucomutase-like phosphatase (HAD superfamily)
MQKCMSKVKGHVEAIIFDMDGTIIKSRNHWGNAVGGFVDSFNRTVDSEEKAEFVASLIGMGLDRTAREIKKFLNIEKSVSSIADEVRQMAQRDFLKGVEYIDGFLSFHEELSDFCMKRGIATNSDEQSFRLIIEKFGFDRMFGEHLYCVDHVGGLAKPDPAIFLHTAKQLGADPGNCVVFEDSVFGFQAAKSAGMKCIAIKNDRNLNKLSMVDDWIDDYHGAENALLRVFGIPKDWPDSEEDADFDQGVRA